MLRNDMTRRDVSYQSDKTEWERQARERTEEYEERLRSMARKLKESENMLDDEQKSRLVSASSKKKLEGELGALSSAMAQLESERDNLLKQNKKLGSGLKEALRESTEAHARAEQHSANLVQSQTKVKSLTNELEEALNTAGSLEQIKKALQEERDQYKDESTYKNTRLSSLQQELAQYKRTVSSLQSELEEEVNSHEELEELVRRVQSQHEQSCQELAVERNKAVRAGDLLSTSERQNRDLKNRIAVLEEDYARSKTSASAVQVLEQKVAKVEALLESESRLLCCNKNSRDRESALRSVRSLERKLRESQQNVEDEHRMVESFKSQVDMANSRNKLLKRNMDEADDELNAMRSKLRKVQNERDELVESVEILQREIAQKSRYAFVLDFNF
ncbi:myosin heavy chain, embryonic smooth muscle isoform-like [Octopus sinensis]|nr:myosin heavy chain, embryonic smooth muscle isoform-like [Octopus sinensis]